MRYVNHLGLNTNQFSSLKNFKLKLLGISLAALLSACGGGGTSGSGSGGSGGSGTGGSPGNALTANLTAPTDKLQWNINSSITFALTDSSGANVTTTGATCAPTVAGTLTVSANCASVTPHRVGVHTITVTQGTATGQLGITVTPQRQALATGGTSESFNAAVNSSGNAFA